MSTPIEFTGLGDLVTCTRCGQHEQDPYNERAWTIFYNSKVPVAILCDRCYLELERDGLLEEEKGILRLYRD